MIEKLKPCPFCGGQAGLFYGDSTDGYIKNTGYVEAFCGSCGARIREFKHDEAVSKWNARPNPWHTGTPTGGGLYFVYDKYSGYGKRELKQDISDEELRDSFHNVIAWQKLDPYEEKKK